MTDRLPNVTGDGGREVQATPVIPIDANDKIGQIGTEGKLEQCIERGCAFSVGTPLLPVRRNEYFKYWLSNPAGSGKRLYVTLRGFSNNRRINQSHLVRDLVINPTADGGGQSVAFNPLDGFSAGMAVGSFGYAIGGAFPEVPALSRNFQSGTTINITVPRIVLPGQSFGYQIAGRGNGNNAVRCSATIVLIVEDYNG